MSSSTTDPVDVPMPQMGVSVAEGTVVAWLVEVGSVVEVDQTICEISTDKIDTEVPAPVGGVVAEILVSVGETVEVGVALARIAPSAGSAVLRAGPVAGIVSPAQAPADSDPRATRPIGVSGRCSPVVQRIAAVHGVDLALVQGTGRGGRVRKQDVLAFVEAGDGGAALVEERPLHSESPYRPDAPVLRTAAPDEPGGVVQLSRMRQSIGGAMRRSLDVAATCTTVVECDMTLVETRRRELGLTALPLVARATVETLAQFPDLNATLDGTTLTRFARVHLGIAVSLGADGLIVPVIHDAQDLSPAGLGARIKQLAARARAKDLTPDDVQGATFTITNPGAFGAILATPIIDLPQVAILDLEAIVRRPVVVSDGDGGEAIGIRSMANLCMSWDHRALDGAYAAQFLTALRAHIEGREPTLRR